MHTKARLTPRLRRAVRWLRRHFPPRRTVVVRVTAKQPGLHGLCIVHDKHALIRISADAEQIMIETLLEEWSHVLRYDTPVPCDDEHDAIFWAILGAVSLAWRGE